MAAESVGNRHLMANNNHWKWGKLNGKFKLKLKVKGLFEKPPTFQNGEELGKFPQIGEFRGQNHHYLQVSNIL